MRRIDAIKERVNTPQPLGIMFKAMNQLLREDIPWLIEQHERMVEALKSYAD